MKLHPKKCLLPHYFGGLFEVPSYKAARGLVTLAMASFYFASPALGQLSQAQDPNLSSSRPIGHSNQATHRISPDEALRIAEDFMAKHGDLLEIRDMSTSPLAAEEDAPNIPNDSPPKTVEVKVQEAVEVETVAPSPGLAKNDLIVTQPKPDLADSLKSESEVSLPPTPDLPGQKAEVTKPFTLAEPDASQTPTSTATENPYIERSNSKGLSFRIDGFNPPPTPSKSLVTTPGSEPFRVEQSTKLPPPSPTLSIEAEGVKVRSSPNTTSLSAETKETIIEAQIGAGYQSTSSESVTASYSIGTMIDEEIAIGGAITTGRYRTDMAANFVRRLGPQEYISLSVGHMRGRERYQFFTGEAEPRLSQSSIALDYQNKAKLNGLGFKSFGLTIWGSRAKQIDRLDALTKTIETETSFDTYLDPRRLSVGTLFGASLAGSVRPTKQFLVEPSIGYERLTFPYSDGLRELHRSQTASLNLTYSFNKRQALFWSTRWGLSETRSSLGLKWGDWSLNLFHSRGEHGLNNSKGVTLNYALLNTETSSRVSPPPWAPITALNLDSLMLEEETHERTTLLKIASTRPIVFTRAWLAKVDSTSVRLIESTPKVIEPPVQNTTPIDNNPAPVAPSTTLSWITTSLVKTYFDAGSPNRTAINFSVAASVNDGSAITYAWGNDPNNLQATLTLDPATGAITGSHPAVANDTTYSFSINASANGVSTLSNNFSVTVKSPVRVRFTTAGAAVELGSATTTATSITLPTDLTSIELLMVGGGGGGGAGNGGGGGAGAVLYHANLTPPTTTVTLSIGAGGAGASQTINNLNALSGSSGDATVFGPFSAIGGGGGGSFGDEQGKVGGSGGGMAFGGAGNTGQPSQVCPAGFSCFGNKGVFAAGQFGYPGGGGGGASSDASVASAAPGLLPSNGGNGYTGTATLGGPLVAGGGGGGYDLNDIVNTGGLPDPGVVALGGSGIGGNGGSTGPGSNAVADTGSGGGGGATGWLNGIYTRYAGGSGSDGLIIVRY